jgi:nucleoid-associated protein YgaU
MGLKESYSDVVNVAGEVGIADMNVKEEGGKLIITGNAPYQREKDVLWDKIKTHASWADELVADIKVQNTDIYGFYTVKSGDTLSKIAKDTLDDAKLYPKIFEANRDILEDPDVIKPGQKLKIPNKA